MGERNHDRQVAEARLEYSVAAEKFLGAVGVWVSVGVPLGTGRPNDPLVWGRREVLVMRELQATLTVLINKRQTWESLLREFDGRH
jgi:hypothetical protein